MRALLALEDVPSDLSRVPSSRASRHRVPRFERPTILIEDQAFAVSGIPTAQSVPVEQVIVTTTTLEPSFQLLADRETGRGIPTIVRTVDWVDQNYDGVDQAARIRTFLRDAYDYWGTRYALLGGDLEQVPTRWIEWSDEEIPTDMYFACLDGEWNEDGDENWAEPLAFGALDGYVTDIATGTDGRLWVSTYFGVAALTDTSSQAWDVRDGLPADSVQCVDVAPDGTVWIGTSQGLARYDGSSWSVWDENSGLADPFVVAVDAVSYDEVWFGTYAGLEHLDGGLLEAWTVTEGIPTVPVTAIASDSSRVWFGTANGAAKLESGSITIYNTSNSGILVNWILSAELDDLGRIWFGHADNFFVQGGLSRWDGVSWFTDDFPAYGGLSMRSLSIAPGGTEFWAATSAGLFHRSGGGDQLLTEADGLVSSDCYATTFTAAGLAVGTAAGVSEGTPGSWNEYTTDDGIPSGALLYDDIDLLPDLLVARLPAQSPAEVDVYRQKLADYQDGVLVDHVEDALFLGEDLFSPGDGKTLAQAAKATFPAGYSATELYQADGNQDVPAVAAALDAGPGWVLSVSHGSYDAMGVGAGLELFFNENVDAVDAGGRSAFVTIYSCNSGAFDLESTSEALLFNPNGGAIGVVANTREAIPSIDAELFEQFFDSLFVSTHGCPTESMHDTWHARVDANEQELSTETWWRRTFLSRTYQGIPTLSVWRAAPGSLTVAHPDSIPFSQAPFAVHVEDATTSLPLQDALVCVQKGTEDYAYGRTDANGDVTFQFRPETLGAVDVRVTTPDHLPYHGTTHVTAQTGPNPVADGWVPAPVPAAREGSLPGQADLQFAVRNAGSASVAGWNLTLVSLDPRLTVVSGAGSLPALNAGESVWAGPFTVAVDTSLVDGQTLPVRLDGTGEVAFGEVYYVTVETPSLRLDGVAGAGNVFQPVLTNLGSADTGAITATLTSLDPAGTVIDGSGALPAGLAPGATSPLSDGFEVTGPAWTPFELRVTDATGREIVRTIDRTIPEPVWMLRYESREDGAQLSWCPSASEDVAGYRVEEYVGSVWQPVFSGPLAQGSLAHVLFPAGESRDFRVCAVDSTGNESSYAQLTAVSFPASLPGWPRRLNSLIGPSPVIVTDLNGDDSPEILSGSMWETNSVHVFDATGVEWTDGDLDATTDGVFGTTEGRIHAAPLAADLDGNGQKEIYAASFDGFVYGWETQGAVGVPTPMPGWPIYHTNMGVRSAPVAADVDGDLVDELVTVANDGLVRAFEADGTPVPGWPKTTGRISTGSTPAVHDLDGDGKQDIVFGGTDSLLYVVSGDGTDFPGWPVAAGHQILCSPVLADLDEDSDYEIICQTRKGDVLVYHHDDEDAVPGADPVAGWPVRIEKYEFTPPSPAIADLDSDGTPEIIVGGGTELVAFHADGTFFPNFPLDLGFDIVNSPVVADLDGNGILEILIGTHDRRLHAICANDAQPLDGWPLTFHERPWSTPFVADVDRDGDLDVAMASDDMYVRVLDLPGSVVPGAAPWPGYHGGETLDGVFVAPSLPTGPDEPMLAPVTAVRLDTAAPNPFRASTGFRFALPKNEPVWLEVYDVSGRRVAAPLQGRVMDAGNHRIDWNGRDQSGRQVASGIYFLRLRAGEEVRTGRVTRLR